MVVVVVMSYGLFYLLGHSDFSFRLILQFPIGIICCCLYLVNFFVFFMIFYIVIAVSPSVFVVHHDFDWSQQHHIRFFFVSL